MALFGGNMVQVTTPDGRQIAMPADLAASFPGLSPVVPSPPQPQPLSPQDRADLAAASAPPPLPAAPAVPPNPPNPPNPVDVPVTSPTQVPPPDAGAAGAGGPGGPRGPVTLPGQATDAGRPNAAQPVTGAQLQRMGAAGAANLELAAQEGQGAAIQRQGEALANQATVAGNAMAAADAHAAQLLEERKQTAEANAQALQAKTDEYLRNAKAIADTRVDRGVDHPILAAISVALAGIGSAMKKEGTNPGLDALYKAIDRKVAGQMQDLDRRRADLGTQRDALGMQRDAGRDRLAEMDTHRLAYLEQAKRQVQTIQQLTNSDVIRTNTGVLAADLGEKQAQTIGIAQAREQQRQEVAQAAARTERMHQQTIGVQIRGQDLEQRKADADRAERASEKLDERSAQLLALQRKQGEERAKEVRERGVWDPSTGNFMITPEGKVKLADADKLEAYARENSDPKLAANQRERAAMLRESANTNDIAMAPDTERSRELAKSLPAAHGIYRKLADLKAQLSGDVSVFDREQWAGIKTKLGEVANEYASTIGEKVSAKALDAFVEHIAGFDTDSVFSRVTGKGKALASIEELEKSTKERVDAQLKSAGIRSGWTPSAPNEASKEQTFSGQTSQEVGVAASPGLVSGIGQGAVEAGKAILYPGEASAVGSGIGRRDPTLAAENAAAASGSYGLDPKDEASARQLIDQAKKAGDLKRAQIVDTLMQPILSGRPGLGSGILGVLRDADPRLLSEVIARIAATHPAKADELSRLEQARNVLPGAALPRDPWAK